MYPFTVHRESDIKELLVARFRDIATEYFIVATGKTPKEFSNEFELSAPAECRARLLSFNIIIASVHYYLL